MIVPGWRRDSVGCYAGGTPPQGGLTQRSNVTKSKKRQKRERAAAARTPTVLRPEWDDGWQHPEPEREHSEPVTAHLTQRMIIPGDWDD